MKKIYSFVTLLVILTNIYAQLPQLMNYQAVVRSNTQGQPVSNTVVNFNFQIHDSIAGGNVVFSETDTVTTNQFGLASIQIGNSSSLVNVNWGTGNKYLQVEVDITGGTNFSDMGTSQLLTVPYAMYAGKVADAIPPHYIGEHYAGGTVFYVYDRGQHGLIADSADLSTGIHWHNGSYRYTGATGDGIGAGAMNTALIVSAEIPDNQSGSFAASICAGHSVTDSTGTTYGAWYLPSQFELNLLYQQQNIVGGFTDNYYWSSTEYGNDGAWARNFSTGNQGDDNQSGLYAVRAIRAF